MKVIFLTHYRELYGANISLLTMIDNLNNIVPYVICPPGGDFYNEIKRREIKCFPLKIIPLFCRKNDRYYFFKGVFKFIQNIIYFPILLSRVLSWKADIIYSNSSVITIGIMLSKILKIPHVWHIRELYSLHYHLKFFLGDRTYKKILNSSTAIISISKYVAQTFLNDITAPIYIVYNGVIKKNELSLKRDEINVKAIRFGVVGKIYPQKGQDIAISAFTKFNEIHNDSMMWIIGESHDEKYYTELKKTNNKNIKFIGHIKNIKKIYDRMDVLIINSQYEAMGRVIAEAMSYGVPVIGNNSGAIPEIIEDKVDGLIYSGTANDLFEKMLAIMDSELYKKMRSNCFKKIETSFTIEDYAKNINKILNDVYEQKLS